MATNTAFLAPGAVLLVTGATGSIGFEIAAQASAAGAVVGVHGSSLSSVGATMERLRERVPGAQLIAAPGDFTSPGVVDDVVAKVAGQAGRLDAVIHCAIAGAPGTTGLFRKTEPEGYGQLAQNVLGVFERLCFAAMPHLVQQGGTIVGFASDAGRFAAPRQSLLAAAYAGIMGFVRNLAVEAARDGVRVHCISPSFVAETRIFDRFVNVNGRAESARDRAGLGLPTPRDIAPMVLFLCGPGAAAGGAKASRRARRRHGRGRLRRRHQSHRSRPRPPDPPLTRVEREIVLDGMAFARARGFVVGVRRDSGPSVKTLSTSEAPLDGFPISLLSEIDPAADYAVAFAAAPVFDARRRLAFVVALTGMQGSLSGGVVEGMGLRLREAGERLTARLRG